VNGDAAFIVMSVLTPIEIAVLAAIAAYIRGVSANLRKLNERTASIEDYLWGPVRARGADGTHLPPPPWTQRRRTDDT
jgi:hypothetical protein